MPDIKTPTETQVEQGAKLLHKIVADSKYGWKDYVSGVRNTLIILMNQDEFLKK